MGDFNRETVFGWLFGYADKLTRLPAFAKRPVQMGGDECEKHIHRSLMTAIASAAAVSEGRSASAGSAEDVKMPRAAAREASLIEQEKLGLEANPNRQGFIIWHIKGKSAGNQENSPQVFHRGGTEDTEKNSPQTHQTDGGQAHTDSHRQHRIGPLSKWLWGS